MTALDFSGKVAIITGASRAIGEAIATAFGEAGATVIVIGRAEGQRAIGRSRMMGFIPFWCPGSSSGRA